MFAPRHKLTDIFIGKCKSYDIADMVDNLCYYSKFYD